MADKVRFIVTPVLDDATVAVSTETAGLEGINVQDELVRRLYRTTAKANEYIHFQASGGATGIQGVFIGRHSLTKDAVVLWQGNTTSNFASGPALNATLTVATDGLGAVLPKMAHFFDSVESYEHWRLYVEDSGNASANLEIGRVVAGRYIEPTINMSDGFTLTTVDPSRSNRTAGRQGYVNVRATYDEFTYRKSFMSEPEHNEIHAIFNKVGVHKPLVVALEPESRVHHRSYYCQFTTDLGRRHHIIKEFDLTEIRFQEKN